MTELVTENYINPFTLEAIIFSRSFRNYMSSCTQIDTVLISALEGIVCSIDEFLDQQLSPVAATNKTILVRPEEVDTIRHMYHCTACKMDLGKDAKQAAVHLADGHKQSKHLIEPIKNKTKRTQEKASNAVIKLPKKANSLLQTDMVKFFTENIIVAEKLKQIPEYDAIEKDLLKVIKPMFPNDPVRVYKFGSRISGIGSRNSDLDIYIDIGKTFSNFENRASIKTKRILARVCDALKENKKDWAHLLAIESARVPIIKVCHVNTKLECDIGFSNGLGYCNTRLLEYLFEFQPIARRMCIFMKKWLERAKLTDFSGYSISLMIIYFLQIKKLLPSLEILQFNAESALFVGPWRASFIAKKPKDFNMETIDIKPESSKEFLKLFFQFYSEFNFGKYAICPYLGELIEIEHIEAKMPERYVEYVANNTDQDASIQMRKCMVVQDPIQLNHNVTKSIVPITLKALVCYFKQSFEVLS